MDIGHPIHLRYHIAKSLNDALIGVVLGFQQEKFHGTTDNLVTTFEDAQSFMCLPRADHQFTVVLRCPLAHLFAAPCPMFINLKYIHDAKVSDPGSLQGLDEVIRGL